MRLNAKIEVVFVLILFVSQHAFSSSDVSCEAVVGIKSVIGCSNPKEKCLLKVEYRCTPEEASICEKRGVTGNASITNFKMIPKVGTFFRLSRETVCSSPKPDGTFPPCVTNFEFVEARDCTPEEIVQQDDFERQAKCNEISTEIERSAKIKVKIDKDEVYECIRKDIIKSYELSNDFLFLAVALRSKDLGIQEIAVKKFEKFDWDQASSDHIYSFYKVFKDQYALTAKQRSNLPQALSSKIDALWKRTQQKIEK